VFTMAVERGEWARVLRALLTRDYWTRRCTADPAYTWYLAKLKATIDVARLATGSEQVRPLNIKGTGASLHSLPFNLHRMTLRSRPKCFGGTATRADMKKTHCAVACRYAACNTSHPLHALLMRRWIW